LGYTYIETQNRASVKNYLLEFTDFSEKTAFLFVCFFLYTKAPFYGILIFDFSSF